MNASVRQVLIIDDDEDDCDIFADAIGMLDPDIDCQKVFSAKTALLLLTTPECKPDLIFLDLNMHVLDGKKCLAEIRKIDGAKEIPVIIYSTSRRASDVAETRALGAVHFITKPSSLSELCSEISFVLEHEWL